MNPELVAREEQGKPYGGRDEAANLMLLNEAAISDQVLRGIQRGIDLAESGSKRPG